MLGHPDDGIVNRAVAVRVVVSHHLADDLGALAVRPVRCQAHLTHPVKDPAMHRLQAVADVRQRTADDHAHRVIEIRPAHLVFDVYLYVIRSGRRLLFGHIVLGLLALGFWTFG